MYYTSRYYSFMEWGQLGEMSTKAPQRGDGEKRVERYCCRQLIYTIKYSKCYSRKSAIKFLIE